MSAPLWYHHPEAGAAGPDLFSVVTPNGATLHVTTNLSERGVIAYLSGFLSGSPEQVPDEDGGALLVYLVVGTADRPHVVTSGGQPVAVVVVASRGAR